MHRLARKKSKRISLRKKHKIVKKASETQKKLRKEARKMARQGIKIQHRKDPGIPNLCPQKKALLEEMIEIKKIESEHNREVKKRSREIKEVEGYQKVVKDEKVSVEEKKNDGVIESARDIDKLKDPYTPVQKMLEKVDKEKLLIFYAIPNFEDIREFLAHIARKNGKIAKGGVPNYDSAAKLVLYDWHIKKPSLLS